MSIAELKLEELNRLDRIKVEFPQQNVEEVVGLDPSKNKKFALWIARQLQKGHMKEDIRPTLELFVANTPRLKPEQRDIYAFEDLKTLEDLLKDLGTSRRKSKEITKDASAEDLGTHDGWKVLRIERTDAAILYGKETRWCITQAGSNYFESYRCSNNLFYFLINENPPADTKTEHKIAVVVNKTTNQITFYNAQDTVVKDFPRMEAPLEVCKKDAENIPYTLEYAIDKGLLPEDQFLEWWNVYKLTLMG